MWDHGWALRNWNAALEVWVRLPPSQRSPVVLLTAETELAGAAGSSLLVEVPSTDCSKGSQ